MELRYRARNGTAKRTTSRLYPYPNEGGVVVGYIFANTDVTSRHQIEAELAEQSAHYQHILNSVSVEIAVFDEEHRNARFYSRINRCRLRSVSASFRQPPTTTALKTCSATPTSPCTAPRRSGRPGIDFYGRTA